MSTQILRDEDMNFPPTQDAYSDESHPVLKDLTLEAILTALKETTDSDEFMPYLAWMHSMVAATAWSMETPQVKQTLQNLLLGASSGPGASNAGSKNKRKKGGNKNRNNAGASEQSVEGLTKDAMLTAIQGLRQHISALTQETKDWAASTCDQHILNALPTPMNKKHFTKLSLETAIEKLEVIQKQFSLMIDIKKRVRTKDIIY